MVILLAPYLTGKIAETQTHNIVNQLNSTLQLDNRLEQSGHTEILSYQRNFYNSQVSYQVKLSPQYSAFFDNSEQVEFSCDVDHNVISVDYLCNVTNNPFYSNLISTYFKGDDPISISGNVNAFGDFKGGLTIEQIDNLKLQDDGEISIAKTQFNVNTDKTLSNYNISGGTNKLSFKTSTESVLVDNLVLTGDLKEIDGGLFTGDFNFSIANTVLKDINNTVSIQGLNTTGIADLNGDNMDSETAVKIDKITLANAPYEVAENLNLMLTVNGVNKEALVEYQALSQKLQQQMLNENQSTEIGLADIGPVLERMLDKGFNLNFGLSGKLDNNENAFSFDLELLQSITMDDIIALAYAPLETLDKLDISIASQFHENTVNADPKLAASVINSPLFEKSNNEYLMDMKIGPKIELNGTTLTIEELSAIITAAAMQQVQ